MLRKRIDKQSKTPMDSNVFEKVNVNSSFSEWDTVLIGDPQGSILGPLFFNIFSNDLLLFVTHSHLSNYTDDNTLYCFSEWFDINYMV